MFMMLLIELRSLGLKNGRRRKKDKTARACRLATAASGWVGFGGVVLFPGMCAREIG